MAANPTPPNSPNSSPELTEVELVYRVLRNWRLGTMAQEDEPAEAFPLVDAVSTPGTTIESGEEELGEIAVSIVEALSSKNELPSEMAVLRPFIEAAHKAVAMHALMRAVPEDQRNDAGLGGYSTVLSAAMSAASDRISFRDWQQLAERFAALNPKDTGQTIPYSDDHLGIDGGFQ